MRYQAFTYLNVELKIAQKVFLSVTNQNLPMKRALIRGSNSNFMNSELS